MKKNFKKILALLVAAVMVLAMAVTAFAETNNNLNGNRTDVAIAQGDITKTTGKLTIENPTANATYTAYKLFSASVASGESTYTWTAEEAWKTVLGTETPESIISKNADQLKTFAASLAAAANGKDGTTITTSADLGLGYYLVVETGTTGLNKSQPILVAIPQAQNDAWVYDITVTPKSSSTDFKKKIAENGSLVDTNAKNIGDYVDYRLYADIPTYEEAVYTTDATTLTFRITDNMSPELTWGANSGDSLKVYVANAPTDDTIAGLSGLTAVSKEGNYSTITPNADTKGGTFTVDFTKTFLSANKGKKVIVAFSAQLNEDAVIGDAASTNNTITGYTNHGTIDGVKDENYNGTGNPNGAKLEYSNSFYGGSDVDTIKDTVTTFTFDLKAEKVDADDDQIKLGGAEFTVYTDPSCAEDKKYSNTSTGFTNPLVTSSIDGDTKGKVTAVGFNEGTYYLKETKAPAGYHKYEGVIKVVIVAGKDAASGRYTGAFTYTVDLGNYNETNKQWEAAAEDTEKENLSIVTVEDEKGLTLPGTGGIGTTIFTFGGLALVVLAAVLFIAYTRKQKKQA